jgi:hypothetical protein
LPLAQVPRVGPHDVPGATQRPSPAQHAPLCVQDRPSQHGAPKVPQGAHSPVRQTWPVRQAVRFRLAAVGQQGWPGSPHKLQRPPEQVPRLVPHSMPAAVQLPPRQQPPPAQRSPAQQGWPWPPQTWQLPALPHTPPVLHVLPAQQLSPISPHETQPWGPHTVSGAEQARPGSTPLQQRLPSLPQFAHRPFAHAPPVVPHIMPFPMHRLL